MRACRQAGVSYLIHENWRWQAPLRALKEVLDSGVIGTPFRARISMVSCYPVFINEPHIADLEDFILENSPTVRRMLAEAQKDIQQGKVTSLEQYLARLNE